MADQNHPFLSLNETSRFEAPAYQSFPSSPSPLPARHGRSATEELDPLLANLSPVSTLEALRATDAVSQTSEGKGKLLASSIAEASEHERALGIRAALAGKKLREWVEEVQSWEWPSNKFAPLQPSASLASSGPQEHYLGSLPARVVREREARIESIRDDMDMLEVEELKSYVRGVHSTTSSGSTSHGFSSDASQSSRYTRVDDFTVVITATIVQALPLLARLEKLLGRWSVRLFVLRQVPGFLQQLEEAQIALGSAWTTLRQEIERGADCEMTREAYIAIKAVLQSRISELAKRIDAILDALEGFEDRIPDQWIDDMENAEADFQNWIIEAEKFVEYLELQTRKASTSVASDLQKPDQDAFSGDQTLRASEASKDNSTVASAPATTAPMAQLQQRSTDDGRPSFDHGSEALFSTQSPNNQAVGAIQQESSPTAKRTPTHGLFFMRNTPPKTGTEAERIDDLSQQAKEITEKVLQDHHNQQETEMSSQDASNEEDQFAVPTGSHPNSHDLGQRRSAAQKLRPIDLGSEEVEPPLGSELSHTTSESSSAYSDMSSPRIMDASPMRIFKTPKEERFPIWVTQDDTTPSRQSSQRTVQGSLGHGRSVSAFEPITRSRASSHLSDITIIQRELSIPTKSYDDNLEVPLERTPEIQQASRTSIESIPRSELHDVAIRRNSGSKARPRSSSGLSLVERSIAAEMAENQKELESWQSDEELPSWQHSPSLRPQKTRNLPAIESNSAEDAVVVPVDSTNTDPEQHKVLHDKLSVKINSILSRIPAPIKLATTAAAKTNDTATPQKQPSSKTEGTPPTRPQRSVLSTPLTLVPVNTRTPSQHQDTEGKLYHLHQPGREVPIKLFIRLVGSEERVMVRVGGGWADLAEYLKEYAIHHQHQGRRSVSDNRFEIKSLSSSPSTTVSGGTPSNRPHTPGSQQPSELSYASTDSHSEQTESTSVSNFSESASTSATSTSWRDQGSSLGLAGPKSKKVDISPQKKAWVDGMLNQARHISFEHKKGDSSEPGDSGGKTKRVFMKTKGEE